MSADLFLITVARSNAFGGYTLVSRVHACYLLHTLTWTGFMQQNYEECMATGDQCALDWTNPANPLAFNPPQTCKQGSIPDYFVSIPHILSLRPSKCSFFMLQVDVKNEGDIVAALDFVSKNNVPLVIKNTGVSPHLPFIPMICTGLTNGLV